MRTALRPPFMPFDRKLLGVGGSIILTYQIYKKAPQVSLRGLSRTGLNNFAALLGTPLLGLVAGSFLCLGEKIYLLGDDLASVTVGTILVCPFGVMDTAGYHDHCTLGDMLCDTFADAIEASKAAQRLTEDNAHRNDCCVDVISKFSLWPVLFSPNRRGSLRCPCR